MLTRRTMLSAMVAAAIGTQLAPLGALAQTGGGKRRLPWRNWSGSQQCFPESRKAPASVAELQELLASTRGIVRPVGAGHSFTPLVPTDHTIVSLSRLSGVVDHDDEKLQATIMAGTRLGEIGQPLSEQGQALINMPDIDAQSLAGCLATATHGTGAGLSCLSAYVTGLQLVTADGTLVDCDAQNNPEVFEAARVSLGSLGVITQVRMQNQATYRLRRETVWREFDEILEIAQDMADAHRNFEFYYIPFSGMGFTDAHDLTDEPISSTEKLDSNEGAMELKTARDWLSWSPGLRELILGSYARTVPDEITIERSWKNYTSERNVRFNEMEYHLPRETGLQALKEIRDALESQHHEVFFPIEVRFVKGDDMWLSPFYKRDSISIAVHRYFEEDFQPYFQTIEPILQKYQGRPHWGKLNTLNGEQLRALYPRWDDFAAVRRELDPHGRFLNDYLHGLFG
ncbi:D-arabinono-1,4-lactone oxidase [Biformimicrobium ophioploci]|uniref:D-arabinono-1,4-lactone oxidase n=1 Tax=Biformimicrobium ophioploci TaxID=3036711 RepID=A0ABQ6LZ62_9GAMM|nr:D-arabinono-1,4-lactone oxidase [Microbulbifer sp. NKW57]GMG87346.1 D-arabinono-1,4-lactone oxidase [Microbulbifer sp. NKW57]